MPCCVRPLPGPASARRTGSPDAHFFAVSIGVQSETGGNLAEILDGLAAVIRSRGMLAKRVKALSSEGRASATLLSVLPALLISFMLLTRPVYYTAKFSDPIFWPVAEGVFVAYLIGLVAIRRIIITFMKRSFRASAAYAIVTSSTL